VLDSGRMPAVPTADLPPNLYGLDRAELKAFLERLGGRPYHGRQLFRWLYGRHRLSPGDWTDLPRGLRSRLAASARVDPGGIAARTEAGDGTVKYLIELAGGSAIEAVLMEERGRATLCLSSQVGCALDCDFCLTGRMGFLRHLSTGEIVGQAGLIRGDRELLATPFNVVFMGMGEPLHNYDNVIAAFRLLTDSEGFGLSRRRITVSTAGLVPGIERLAREPAPPRLAVSLSATTDELRDRLMPINRKYPLARLLAACREFAVRSKERFTFEYVLLEGVNDSDADVDRLARLVLRNPAKVNLIPFNPVPGHLPYRSPSRRRVVAIRDRLLARHVPVSIRWSKGAEARAACGQLALDESLSERRVFR
jgi:23S rRNA (adenine2503-C2)-methyltransferase